MIPPDEVDDYKDAQERVMELFKEFDFSAIQCLVVLTMLTCAGYQVLERTKEDFLEEISKVWDCIE